MCQTGKIATPSWVVQLSERLEYHGLVGLYLKPIENITALLYRVFLRGRGFKSGFYKRYASLSDRRYESFLVLVWMKDGGYPRGVWSNIYAKLFQFRAVPRKIPPKNCQKWPVSTAVVVILVNWHISTVYVIKDSCTILVEIPMQVFRFARVYIFVPRKGRYFWQDFSPCRCRPNAHLTMYDTDQILLCIGISFCILDSIFPHHLP